MTLFSLHVATEKRLVEFTSCVIDVHEVMTYDVIRKENVFIPVINLTKTMFND